MEEIQNQLLQKLYSITDYKEQFYELVKILRKHCSWDKEQNMESLKQSLLEECYEVMKAIDQTDEEKKIFLKEELGDLLFLVHFYIYLSEEKELFNIEDVYLNTIQKLIRRHPHVFGNQKVNSTKEILKNWESFKNKELGIDTEFFPALLRADKVQRKASLEGFDWQPALDNTHIKCIIQQIKDEIIELEKELEKEKNLENIEMEIGDILFSIVNLARHLKISSEITLHKSIDKFIKRFKKVMEIYKSNYNYQMDVHNKSNILEKIYQDIKKSNENL